MKTSEVVEIMKNTKNGTFGVVEYETEMPVNKEAKDSGIKVFCKTKKMVRFGADYKNLIKDLATAEAKPRANNYMWVLENKVAHNSKTDKDYLRVSNINRRTISRKYSVVTPEEVLHFDRADAIAKFLRPSSSSSSFTKPIVQNITVDNLISINGVS